MNTIELTWDVDFKSLNKFCKAVRRPASPGFRQLDRFLSVEQRAYRSPWTVDELPSVGDQHLPEQTDRAYWKHCLRVMQKIRDHLRHPKADEHEQQVVDEIATAWLRREVLGAWLRNLELEKEARLSVVFCFVMNYIDLHNALKRMTLRHALRLLPEIMTWSSEPIGKNPVDREKGAFDWVLALTSDRLKRARRRQREHGKCIRS